MPIRHFQTIATNPSGIALTTGYHLAGLARSLLRSGSLPPSGNRDDGRWFALDDHPISDIAFIDGAPTRLTPPIAAGGNAALCRVGADRNRVRPIPPTRRMMRIGLGGGCHWCTEGVVQALRGVAGVEQGFLRSDPPWDAWAEGVVATFDPAVLPLDTLVEVHLRTHSGGGTYSPNGRYRSAVYVCEAGQHDVATAVIARVAAERGEPARTLVLPFRDFTPPPERYRDYYRTDPNRPFCRRYIDPKLDFLRARFGHIVRPG